MGWSLLSVGLEMLRALGVSEGVREEERRWWDVQGRCLGGLAGIS